MTVHSCRSVEGYVEFVSTLVDIPLRLQPERHVHCLLSMNRSSHIPYYARMNSARSKVPTARPLQRLKVFRHPRPVRIIEIWLSISQNLMVDAALDERSRCSASRLLDLPSEIKHKILDSSTPGLSSKVYLGLAKTPLAHRN